MQEENKFFKGFIVGLLVALASAAILIVFMRDYLFNAAPGDKSGVTSTQSDEKKYNMFIGKLNNMLTVIKKDFYEDVDPEVLYEGALDGIMAALDDPYSCYYTAEEATAVFQATSGSYVGIGCYVGQLKDTDDIVVVSVMEDSPAEKAGLKPEDILIGVDGKDITNLSLDYAMSLVKGAEGSEVVITVKRGDETLDLPMKRAKIEQKTVSYRMLDDGIGYILVSAFYDNTTQETKAALEDLEKQGMTRLIIDLRENPGGLFDTAVSMLDLMLEKGLLVAYTDSKQGDEVKSFTKNDDVFDKPVVILINGNSASASELFTQTMRDYEKATVMGTTSYGKGVYQTLWPIGEDNSFIKYTGGRYYSPKGVCIHGTGIEPDIVVELEEGLEKEVISKRTKDNQIDAAVEYLKNK